RADRQGRPATTGEAVARRGAGDPDASVGVDLEAAARVDLERRAPAAGEAVARGRRGDPDAAVRVDLEAAARVDVEDSGREVEAVTGDRAGNRQAGAALREATVRRELELELGALEVDPLLVGRVGAAALTTAAELHPLLVAVFRVVDDHAVIDLRERLVVVRRALADKDRRVLHLGGLVAVVGPLGRPGRGADDVDAVLDLVRLVLEEDPVARDER